MAIATENRNINGRLNLSSISAAIDSSDKNTAGSKSDNETDDGRRDVSRAELVVFALIVLICGVAAAKAGFVTGGWQGILVAGCLASFTGLYAYNAAEDHRTCEFVWYLSWVACGFMLLAAWVLDVLLVALLVAAVHGLIGLFSGVVMRDKDYSFLKRLWLNGDIEIGFSYGLGSAVLASFIVSTSALPLYHYALSISLFALVMGAVVYIAEQSIRNRRLISHLPKMPYCMIALGLLSALLVFN